MTLVHRTEDGTAFEVIRRGGSGPAVMLLHEVLGMTPECIAFADRIAASGFSVYLPLFFGRSGKKAGWVSIARFCIRREIVSMSVGAQSSSQGPLSNWLRSLAARLHADPQHRSDVGVGVIGMCLTGRFVLSTMLAFPTVRAGVMCQPATPMPVGRARRSASGINNADLDALEQKLPTDGPSILGIAFKNDALSPAPRLCTLERRLAPRFEAISLPSGGSGQPPGQAHSVFTGGYPTESCADIEVALQRVVVMLRHRLCDAPRPVMRSERPERL